MIQYIYISMLGMGGANSLSSKRRELIKAVFNANPKAILYVNCKWCIQLKYDADLRKLMKSGFLKQIRNGTKTSNHTYLVKA